MKIWQILLPMALVCFLAFGVLFACGDDDDDDDNDDNDDDTWGPADNPIPPDQCDDYCTQANVDTFNGCFADVPYYEEVTVADCMEGCLDGYIDQAVKNCIDVFTTCEALIECVGEAYQ